MRIAKFIAGSGVCSRRDAEKLIMESRVKLDGKIVLTPAVKVTNENKIEVDGCRVTYAEHPRLWIYYKPVGLVSTHKDPKGRSTVFGALSKKLPRVISVGRLDINSEGLLLLTNSGDLARYFESPKNKIERLYRVRAFGGSYDLNISNKTITIEGVRYKVREIKKTQNLPKNELSSKSNIWYDVVLTEGKNREVRKIFDHFGWKVNRLIRVRFGKYSLGSLQAGEFQEVEIDEDCIGAISG